MDTKPNAAYLMDTDGRVAFRPLWAGDEHALRQVLDSVSTGRAAAKPQSRAMLKPMARGVGYFHEVLKAAGPQAQRDILLAVGLLFIWTTLSNKRK